jgi:hypothetical protein
LFRDCQCEKSQLDSTIEQKQGPWICAYLSSQAAGRRPIIRVEVFLNFPEIGIDSQL